MLTIRGKMEIERDGHPVATVKKALVGLRDRFTIHIESGGELKATGNIVNHEYKIERDGTRSPRSPSAGFACATPTGSRWRPRRTRR